MIKRIEISGIHYKLELEVKNYVLEKIGKLDRYMSSHARASVHAEVKLKGSPHKNKHMCSCELVLHMPQEIMRVEESSSSMTAAVDLAQARLKNLLKKYKDKHKRGRGRRIIRKILKRIR